MRGRLGLLPICAAAGVFFASGTARIYLVPFHARAAGASSAEIGLLFSGMQLCAAAAAIPAGMVVDRYGRRRVLVAAALLGAGNLVAIAGASWFPLELLLQGVGGVSGSAGMATCMALAVDRTSPTRLGSAVASVTLSNQVGYLAGPALAALLLRWLSVDADLVASGCLALLVLAIVPLIEEPSRSTARRGRLGAAVRSLAGRRDVASVFLAMLAATLLWGTLEAFLPLFASERLRLSESVVGVLLAFQALLNGASRYPAGRIANRMAGGPAIFALTTGYGAMLVAATQVRGLAGGLILCGSVVLIATAFVLLATAFAALSDEANRGTVMGVYTTAIFVGLSAGPLGVGPIVQVSDFAVGFTACAVTAIALSFVALFVIGGRSPARPALAGATLDGGGSGPERR